MREADRSQQVAGSLSVEFTTEEIAALRAWLAVLGFQGTAEQVRRALALYDAIMEKLERASTDEEQRQGPL